jgi:cell wall-associated NlpC family hydrolase
MGSASDRRLGPILVLTTCVGLISGCVGAPPRPPGEASRSILASAPIGDEIVVPAIAQLGTPYRYGGADRGGFDCSGLVYHVYRELGFDVPRTAAAQYAAARHLTRSELRPGDLVFFRTRGGGVSHVGIYAGEDRFVHAPQTGRTVELRSLDDGYYGEHFAGGGRLPGGPLSAAATAGGR